MKKGILLLVVLFALVSAALAYAYASTPTISAQDNGNLTFTVTGSGFNASTGVSVWFKPVSGGIGGVKKVGTVNGDFTVTIKPYTGCGTYNVTASGQIDLDTGEADTASTTVTLCG